MANITQAKLLESFRNRSNAKFIDVSTSKGQIVTYTVHQYSPDLTEREQDQAIQDAWGIWSPYVYGMTFRKVASGGDLNIYFTKNGDSAFPPPRPFIQTENSSEFAVAFASRNEIYINDDCMLKLSGSFDLVTLLAHEFGHLLGIPGGDAHAKEPGSLMFREINAEKRSLSQEDINLLDDAINVALSAPSMSIGSIGVVAAILAAVLIFR